MRPQDIRIGVSYVNKSGRAERLVLDRGLHLVNCAVWDGAEPDDLNHQGEEGVLYIETRLGKTYYGSDSERRPVARFVGAFATWAKNEVLTGQEASRYTSVDVERLCQVAQESTPQKRQSGLRVFWLSKDGEERIALVSHPQGFDVGSDVLAQAYKNGRGSGKIKTKIFLTKVRKNDHDEIIEIREIIYDGNGSLCLSPEVTEMRGGLLCK